MYFPFLVHGTNIPWENGPRSKLYGILVPWWDQNFRLGPSFHGILVPRIDFLVTGQISIPFLGLMGLYCNIIRTLFFVKIVSYPACQIVIFEFQFGIKKF